MHSFRVYLIDEGFIILLYPHLYVYGKQETLTVKEAITSFDVLMKATAHSIQNRLLYLLAKIQLNLASK